MKKQHIYQEVLVSTRTTFAKKFWSKQMIPIMTPMPASIFFYLVVKPYTEPIISDGTFVMKTPHEITQAYNEYYDGKYGNLPIAPL